MLVGGFFLICGFRLSSGSGEEQEKKIWGGWILRIRGGFAGEKKEKERKGNLVQSPKQE